MKKLLVFMMTLLMVLTMVGCGPKEPVIEEPQVVALTEEGALDLVEGLPENMTFSFVSISENELLRTNISTLYQYLNTKYWEAEVDADGNGSIAVADLQTAIDNIYGKDRFDVSKLYEKLIVDGNIVSKIEVNSTVTYKDKTCEVYEVTDNYIVIKVVLMTDLNVIDEVNGSYTMEDVPFDIYFVVYPTVDGLKVWDNTSNLDKITYPEQ